VQSFRREEKKLNVLRAGGQYTAQCAFLEKYAKSKDCQLCMGVKLGLTNLGKSV
jgi:hypothetical protein